MTIQFRRRTPSSWTSANPVLAAGQPGWEKGTAKFKIGDGTTAWNDLPYAGAGAPIYSIGTASSSFTETTTSGDRIVLVSGTVEVTLPSAVGNKARLTYKLVTDGAMTIAAASGQTVDDDDAIETSIKNTSFTFISDNANWKVV